MKSMTSFPDMGVAPWLVETLAAEHIVHPTAIQAETIPPAIEGRDIIGQAQTGSGKTAAFVIPILNKLNLKKKPRAQALVLVPTRELAHQVVTEVTRFGGDSVRVVSVVGGENGYRQVELVNAGCHVVVATPGRMLDHLREGRLPRFAPKTLVLDEADEMLDMGFIDDIIKIMEFLPEERQSLLFSATMPEPIAKLARREMKDPIHICLNHGQTTHEDIEQNLYVVKFEEKLHALHRLLSAEPPEKAIVFSRTRSETDDLASDLSRAGMRAAALHGDLPMEQRRRTLDSFRSGRINILVATDVASRGIDVNDISHVFNFSLPGNKDRYLHRIGRTGRAGSQGRAITFATPHEVRTSGFFRAFPLSQFKLRTAPTTSEVKQLLIQRDFEDLRNTEVTEEAIGLVRQLCKGNDPTDLLCYFVSRMHEVHDVRGPEYIGVPVDQIKRLTARPGSKFKGGKPRGGKTGRRPTYKPGQGSAKFKSRRRG